MPSETSAIEVSEGINWHGWPPQVWDGKRWRPIRAAELVVAQAERIPGA
jgi:hypothetical protein